MPPPRALPALLLTCVSPATASSSQLAGGQSPFSPSPKWAQASAGVPSPAAPQSLAARGMGDARVGRLQGTTTVAQLAGTRSPSSGLQSLQGWWAPAVVASCTVKLRARAAAGAESMASPAAATVAASELGVTASPLLLLLSHTPSCRAAGSTATAASTAFMGVRGTGTLAAPPPVTAAATAARGDKGRCGGSVSSGASGGGGGITGPTSSRSAAHPGQSSRHAAVPHSLPPAAGWPQEAMSPTSAAAASASSQRSGGGDGRRGSTSHSDAITACMYAASSSSARRRLGARPRAAARVRGMEIAHRSRDSGGRWAAKRQLRRD
jgi:hypothetical protein